MKNIFIALLLVSYAAIFSIAETPASAIVALIFKGQGQVDSFDVSGNVVNIHLMNNHGRLQLKSQTPNSVGGCVKVFGNIICNVKSATTLQFLSLDNLQFYNCQQIDANGGAHECGLRSSNEGGDGDAVKAAIVMSPKSSFQSVSLGGSNNNQLTMNMRGIDGSGSGGGNEFE